MTHSNLPMHSSFPLSERRVFQNHSFKILSLKHTQVKGCEIQYYHPFAAVEKDLSAMENKIQEAALWALLNGWEQDTSAGMFEVIGNASIKQTREPQGQVDIPGGWHKDRVVFELRVEMTTPHGVTTEVISGYMNEGIYYPTRLSFLLNGHETGEEYIHTQSSVIYSHDHHHTTTPEQRKFLQTPKNLGGFLQVKEMWETDAGVDIVDMRANINNYPRLFNNHYLTPGYYLNTWSQAFAQAGSVDVFSPAESRDNFFSSLPGEEVGGRRGFLGAVVKQNSAAEFAEKTLVFLDPTFVPEMNVLPAPSTVKYNHRRLCCVSSSPSTGEMIRQVLNILQSEPVTLKKDIHHVTYEGDAPKRGIVTIPEDMYDTPEITASILEKFDAYLINHNYMVCAFTVDLCLAGNTYVTVNHRGSMHAGDYYCIPTYAGGLLSPFIVNEMKDMAPMAALLERMTPK